MTHPLRHLRPVPELTLRLDGGAMQIGFRGADLGRLPLSLPALHSLFDALDPQLLFQGMRLRLPEKSLRTPLGFEALLQTIMLNMVHCVFPRTNGTTPLRARLQIQSLDAETNFIRNAQFVNQVNHVHIAKDRLAGLPMLVALPGPSLDCGFIRRHRGSFILLAAGRAARPLVEAGIEPDLIYMQDVNAAAWDVNFAFLGGRRLSSVLIANPLGAQHKYFHNFARVFKAWNLYPFEQDRFPKLEEIAPSSVSGAYSAARLLGCDPILFLGNDCGEVVPPLSDAEPPGDMTDHAFEREGNDLVFAPVERRVDLYLRFADEFSIRTRNDYVAASQWLKMRAARDAAEGGRKIYDSSRTRVCQFNSVIMDASRLDAFREAVLPPLSGYATRCDPRPVLLGKQRAFSFILRQLRRGVLPESVLKRPYSCILQGTRMAAADSLQPQDGDIAIAAANAETMLGHVEAALAGVAADVN